MFIPSSFPSGAVAAPSRPGFPVKTSILSEMRSSSWMSWSMIIALFPPALTSLPIALAMTNLSSTSTNAEGSSSA